MVIKEEPETKERIKRAQEEDTILKRVRQSIIDGKLAIDDDLVYFKSSFRRLKIIDGIILKVSDGETKIVVPDAFKAAVMESVHNGGCAAHFGLNKCYAALKSRYFWPYMHACLEHFLNSCIDCQKFKRPYKNNKVATQPVYYENRIGAQISIDYKGPLPVTKVDELYPIKYRFIMLIIDHASKYLMAIPTPNMTAEWTAEMIITKWFPMFGYCDVLICDNGTSFKSKLMKNICKRLQITMNNSSVYNPRANGLVEVNNKLLGSMLFSMTKDKVDEWNRYLDFVISGYNASTHTTTKYTPNFLVFGRELVQPVDVVFGYKHDFMNTKGWLGWDAEMKERIRVREKALNQAYINNEKMQQKTRENSEKTAHAIELKIGERCGVSLPNSKRKTYPPWDVNYVIIDKTGPTTYVVRHMESDRVITISRRHLKRVIDRDEFAFPQATKTSGGSCQGSGESKEAEEGGEEEEQQQQQQQQQQ